MKSAIKKAIAGPIHSNFLPPQKRRLSTLANWIFVRQLYDLCRRKDLADAANNETLAQNLLANFSSSRLTFDERIKWIAGDATAEIMPLLLRFALQHRIKVPMFGPDRLELMFSGRFAIRVKRNQRKARDDEPMAIERESVDFCTASRFRLAF